MSKIIYKHKYKEKETYYIYDGRAWGEWIEQDKDGLTPYHPDRAWVLCIEHSIKDVMKVLENEFPDAFVVDENHNYVHIEDHPMFKEKKS
jgi:hypothetical protein